MILSQVEQLPCVRRRSVRIDLSKLAVKADREAVSESYDLERFRCELNSLECVSRKLRLKGSAESLQQIAIEEQTTRFNLHRTSRSTY